MSFDIRERSLSNGQPIRLYRFNRGVLYWLYNSSDRDITFNNQIFRTLRGGISDGGLRQTGQASADSFVITAPADIEVAQPFRGMPPSAEIALRVYDLHYGDVDAKNRFVGSISTVKFPTLDTCTITCNDIESSMQRPGLTDTFSRSCTTTLYSIKCKVNRDLFRVETSIQGLDGAKVTNGVFEGYPDGWFTAGFLEWDIEGGEFERRHIELHTGSVLQLLGGTTGLTLGQSIRLYPGCDFLAETCNDKFSNLDNFRGQNAMDGKSPFDGDQVF